MIPRALPSGSGDAPVRAFGCELERAQRPRAAGEQLASQVDRVAAGGDRELVDRRLARELRVGVADRSPHHRRDPRLEVGRLEPEVLDRVWRIDRAGRREEVDAVREHHVTDERQVHGRRLGHDLLMPRGQATVGVGAGPDAVNGHRAVAADLEFLLAERLDLDRVLPIERSRDLHRFGRRVVLCARVQSERSAGERDVHLHLLLVDPGDRGGVHLHVLGCLGPHPHLEHAVLAHPAGRVVRLHRGVSEVRQRVRRVDRRGCVGQGLVDVAVVASRHGVLARLEQPEVLG